MDIFPFYTFPPFSPVPLRLSWLLCNFYFYLICWWRVPRDKNIKEQIYFVKSLVLI